MTYRELKQAVVDLGFDENVESDTMMVSATNRALAQINRLRRASASVVFTQKIHRQEEGEEMPDHIVGVIGEEEIIPVIRGGYAWYDFGTITDYSDFSFATTPYGTRFEECRLQAEKIGFPVRFLGDLDITYFRKIVPARLDNFLEHGEYEETYREEREEKVDVAHDREDMLPLLVAAYVWADDGQGRKANYYMQLYNEQVGMYLRQSHRNGQDTVNDAKGWI